MSGESRARSWRIAVVGCGSIGRRHIRNLARAGIDRIVGIEPREDRREAVEALGVRTAQSLHEAWRWTPDAVFVCTPTSVHMEPAIEAARRGCHLFIEKPLSHDTTGVRTLLELAEKHELVTLVGCNLRFHPGLRRVKELLDEGVAGTIVAARVQVGQYLPDWRPSQDYRTVYSARSDLGGGIILDAVHEIDYARWLLGEVDELVCFADRLSHLEIETEDTAALLLRFASGAIGELHLDYVQRSYARTCEIIGDRGTIRWDFGKSVVGYDSFGGRREYATGGGPGWDANEMYVEELAHFLRCLEGRDEPCLDVFDGARVLELALAAKESSARGRVIDVRRGSTGSTRNE